MGMDLYCPNCDDNLGKQSEIEADEEGRPGKVITVWCGRCGQSFKHKCIYKYD